MLLTDLLGVVAGEMLPMFGLMTEPPCPGAGAVPLAPSDGVGVEFAVDRATDAWVWTIPEEVSIGRLLRIFSSRRHFARRLENHT